MATINHERVLIFAEKLKEGGNVASSLDFYHTFDGKAHDAAMYPSFNDPEAINFFFFACLHQYGFWYNNQTSYLGPMFATFDGKQVKGSDAIWKALKRARSRHDGYFRPRFLYHASEGALFERIFVDDEGPIRFPDPVTRARITREYGLWFERYRTSPSEIVSKANEHVHPLENFLDRIRSVDGFDSDSFQKKSRLLAMTLMNRPEKFLKPAPGEQLGPIVDYHLMRVALRLGLVDLDEEERAVNANRVNLAVVGKDSHESVIRREVHCALTEVLRLSGVTPETLDFALWSARRYCPEMEEPNCGKCRFESACAKRTELFQPVLRTTAY